MTKKIHIRTESIAIRIFKDDNCYDDKDRYDGIIQGWALSDYDIFLSGASAKLNRSEIKEIRRQLKEMGFKAVWMLRRNVIKRREL